MQDAKISAIIFANLSQVLCQKCEHINMLRRNTTVNKIVVSRTVHTWLNLARHYGQQPGSPIRGHRPFVLYRKLGIRIHYSVLVSCGLPRNARSLSPPHTIKQKKCLGNGGSRIETIWKSFVLVGSSYMHTVTQTAMMSAFHLEIRVQIPARPRELCGRGKDDRIL